MAVAAAGKGIEAATAANTIYAGWSKEIIQVNQTQLPTIHKVKGHVQVTEELGEEARKRAVGSSKADELAGKGAALRAADSGQGEAHAAAWKTYTALARTVVEALSLWPPPKQLNGEHLKRVAGVKHERGTPPAKKHELRWIGGKTWACLTCHRRMSEGAR